LAGVNATPEPLLPHPPNEKRRHMKSLLLFFLGIPIPLIILFALLT
jgi:hypothetical protein